MKKFILLTISCLLSVSGWGAKADPTPVVITQSDGTQLMVMGYGDEDFHWFTTTDDVLLVRKGYDYFVARQNTTGDLVASKILAHECGKRSSTELLQIAKQDKESMLQAAQKYHNAAKMKKIGIGDVNPMYFPHMGSPRALVFLVEFSDVKFTVTDPYKTFNEYLNHEGELQNYGYREDRNHGSVRKYFSDMSDGQFTPQFDVVGPITLDNTSAYYGKGENDNINDLLKDAGRKAISEKGVDFSLYDSNNDGFVDLVYVIYAGYSASIGGNSEDDIYPKSGTQNVTETIKEGEKDRTVTVDFNGMKISRYGVHSELNYSPNYNFSAPPYKRVNGIGLFCHEFSHTLGLPDIYAKDKSARIDNQAMEYWDLMDGGEYTDNGYTPTPYTPWEKEVMGWKTIEILEHTPQTLTLKADEARKIECEGSKEYVILHNVQGMGIMDKISGEGPADKDSWAAKMMGHGLMVYRIDYGNRTSVNLGDYPNNKAGEPGITTVSADSLLITSYRVFGNEIDREQKATEAKPYSTEQYQESHYGDTYPGTQNVTQIDSITLNKAILRTPIYKIKENRQNGTVSFNFMKENIITCFDVDKNHYEITDFENNNVEICINEAPLEGEFVIPSKVEYEGVEYTVSSIAANGYSAQDITSVTIPESVVSIGANAFDDCIAIETVTVNATTPPVACYNYTEGENANNGAKANGIENLIALFDENVYQSATLYVPEGCVNAYANANGWQQFTMILEIGDTPDNIEHISVNTKGSNAIFTIDGRRVNSNQKLAPGIYIVGKKKIVVK